MNWNTFPKAEYGSEAAPAQELLALMLAVQRSSVATAAAPLMKEGLIRVRRGSVHILDAEGLTEKACECYSVLKKRRLN